MATGMLSGLSGLGGLGGSEFDESALYEDDEELDILQRRMAAGRSRSVMHPTTNPMLDSIRRQHWGAEGPQSRRHSFNIAPNLPEEDYELGSGHSSRFGEVNGMNTFGGRGTYFLSSIWKEQEN